MNRVDISPGTARDLESVAARMRESDIREFLALSYAKSHEDLCADLVLSYGGRKDLIAVRLGNTPVAIGATILSRPNVAVLLFFATDDFHKVAVATTRFIRRFLFPRLEQFGVHRIECVSIDGYDAAHQWIRTLGLKQEAVLSNFGRNGETFIQFSKVHNVCKTSC